LTADLPALLTALTNFSALLSTEPDLNRIIQEVVRLLACDTGLVWRWDSSEEKLVLLSQTLLSQTESGQVVDPNVSHQPEIITLPAVRNVLRRKVPHQLAIKDPFLGAEYRRLLQAQAWSQVLFTPLLYHDQPVGLITLARMSQNSPTFTAPEIQLSRLLADQLTLVLTQTALKEEVAAKNRLVGRISNQLVQAQETERRRISRELHDELGQALTALKINIDIAAHTLPEAPAPKLQRGLQEASRLAEEILESTRRLSLELRPPMLDDLGVIPALRWSLDRYEQRTGQAVYFKVNLADLALTPLLETALYRITQEALTNIARHAQANRVWVDLLKETDQLCLRVRDDGRGFDPKKHLDSAAQYDSLGLVGMRERVTTLGGTLKITSDANNGTCLEACFPLNESDQSK
jgi:signal transduction histidine kinase